MQKVLMFYIQYLKMKLWRGGGGGQHQGEGILENNYFSPFTSKKQIYKKWNYFF
jgi:hypothetical protein